MNGGRILLIQRADNGLWATPGGGCDVGESAATTGEREVWEETGYRVKVTNLLGIFDSRHCRSQMGSQLYHILAWDRGFETLLRRFCDACGVD